MRRRHRLGTDTDGLLGGVLCSCGQAKRRVLSRPPSPRLSLCRRRPSRAAAPPSKSCSSPCPVSLSTHRPSYSPPATTRGRSGGRPHQPEPAPEAPPCAAARPAAGAGCQPRPEPPRPRLSSCVASVLFPTANDAFVLLPRQNTDEEQPVNSTRARPALGRRDWERRAGAEAGCGRAAGRELRPGA